MNAQQLFYNPPDGTPVPQDVWFCEKCRILGPTKALADQCCQCTICGKPIEAGDRWYGGGSSKYHQSCHHQKQARHYSEKLASAEVVPHWDGWVYTEDCGYASGHYFEDMDSLIEHFEDQEDNPLHCWPDRVFIVEPRYCGRHLVDETDILERILENYGYEDEAPEDLTKRLHGYDALKAAIDAFNAANTDLYIGEINYTKVALVPKGEVAERYAAEQAFEDTYCTGCRRDGVTPDACDRTYCHHYEKEAPRG